MSAEMERFRRRPSSRDSSASHRVSTGFDWSSEERPFPADRHLKDSFPWSKEGRRENNIQKLGSNSRSRRNRMMSEEDMLMLHLGQHTSGLLTGTVMKKLLADEMSKGIESRRRPSVVAKLMGLDGFPPPHQHVDKQDKRIPTFQKYGNLYESQSNRTCSKEQQQFKDVYEVAVGSKFRCEGSESQVSFSGNNRKDGMAFSRERFLDEKRPSTYEKFRDTKEFNDALEVLDSNKDLMLKFLDTPDSMFVKHLHYMRDARESHCGHGKGVKSSALKHNINAIGSQSSWEDSRKIDVSFSHKHQDGLHSHSCRKRASQSQILSRFSTEMKDNPNTIPTRIVVLKPNTAKLQNSGKYRSSHDNLSYSEVRKEKHTWHAEAGLWSEKHLPDGLNISGLDCRESRQLAREITRQMKQKLGNGSFNVHLNGYKGYSADESSRDLSGNDSSYDSEATNVLPKMPLHWRSRGEASGSRYTELSVNREARKRLSERWKMTRRSQESGPVGSESTLGEVLAIPELHARLSDMEATIAHDGSCRLGRKERKVGSIAALGISSKDGWKYVPLGKLSRSRSFPASSDYLGSLETSWRREALVAERFLVPKERISRRRNKAIRSGSVRTSNKKYAMVYHQDRDVSDVSVVQSRINPKEGGFEDNNSPDVKAVISEIPATVIGPSLIIDEVVDLEPGNFPQSLTCPDEQIAVPEFPGDMTVQDVTCSSDLHKEPSKRCQKEDSTCLQYPASEPELHGSIEEDQPSPNSILEGSLIEDLSSGSECFGRVNADLHGLRMQLQLLKLESEAHDESPLLVSSDDDDVKDGLNGLSEASRIHNNDEESWMSCYLVDVLADSGFDDSNPQIPKATWHSVGCLVDPWVFEKLEKKYLNEASCSRVERRLVFDRINSGITEILELVTDPHPWVNHGKKRIACPQGDNNKDGIRAQLWQLLKRQEEEVETESTLLNRVLESDLKWMDLADHIDGVAREIEKLMIDELVADFVTI
ncbi:hypothetical protein Dimus_007275 [Dionaea muscipula]